jgi:hypothetical protein
MIFKCFFSTAVYMQLQMRWKDAYTLQKAEDSEGEGRGIFQLTVSIFA